ncbi:MAG: HNH endonuclease signature motif containing protein, partial [Candidatus Eremiobacterota bacterium]
LRSDPSYLRKQVWLRDRGRCARCGLDTKKVRRLLGRARRASPAEFQATLEVLREQGFPPGRPDAVLWHVDHITPVAEGGGLCGLENVRTLCLPCHRQATAELRARLSSRG